MRTILEVQLSKEREFELHLPYKGIIRRFEMGLQEQKVATGLLVPSGQKVLREIPVIFVEANVEASPVTRKFKIIQATEPVEDEYQYVASALSQPAMCWFHLFERIDPPC